MKSKEHKWQIKFKPESGHEALSDTYQDVANQLNRHLWQEDH